MLVLVRVTARFAGVGIRISRRVCTPGKPRLSQTPAGALCLRCPRSSEMGAGSSQANPMLWDMHAKQGGSVCSLSAAGAELRPLFSSSTLPNIPRKIDNNTSSTGKILSDLDIFLAQLVRAERTTRAPFSLSTCANSCLCGNGLILLCWLVCCNT